MTDPLVFDQTVTSSLSPDEAVTAIAKRLAADGLEVDRESASELSAVSGSRLRLRLLGVAGTAARQMPLRLSVDVAAAREGSRVSIQMTSDEGRYLVRMESLVVPVYQDRFDELVAAIAASVGAQSS